MEILSVIANLFKPAADLVDELVTSDEEKGKLKNELAKIQNEMLSKIVEADQKAMEATTKVQIAEAGSEGVLTRSWRPLSILLLLGIIVLASLGYAKVDDKIYEVFQMLLGIGVAGRSVEKIAGIIKG